MSQTLEEIKRDGLQQDTVPQLRRLCKALGIRMYSHRPKGELIEMIIAHWKREREEADRPQYGYHSWSPEERAEYDAMYDR